MQYSNSLKCFTALFFATGLLYSSAVHASLSTSKLKSLASDPAYDKIKDSFVEAITYSIKQNQPRVKVLGATRFHLEVGYQIFDVNDRYLYQATSNDFSPDSFQSLQAKIGMGLPWGFDLQAGVSQVITEHRLTGVTVTVANQIFDFSTAVYTDLVPSIVLAGSISRAFSGPPTNIFSAQANLGAYHRSWFAQFAYVFDYTYSMMMGTSPASTLSAIRHGFVLHAPLVDGWFLRSEFFAPILSATLMAGYQF